MMVDLLLAMIDDASATAPTAVAGPASHSEAVTLLWLAVLLFVEGRVLLPPWLVHGGPRQGVPVC